MTPKESAKKAVPGRKKATATKVTATKKPSPTKKPTARKAPAKTAASKTSKGPARRPAPGPARSRKGGERKAKTPKALTKKPTKTTKKPPAKKAKAKALTSKAATKTKAAKTATPKAAAVAKEPVKKSLLERVVPRRKPGSVICPLSGFEVMPTSPNLSAKTVERLRRKLVDERGRHLRQAEELQAEADALAMERDPGDTQFDEESGEGDTVNVERERDLLLSASARQIVEAIDRALARMSADTFGLCVPAGRRIALERLEAIPYAEECVDCKARAERRR